MQMPGGDLSIAKRGGEESFLGRDSELGEGDGFTCTGLGALSSCPQGAVGTADTCSPLLPSTCTTVSCGL